MGLFEKDRQKQAEERRADFRIVLERLEKLARQGIVAEDGLTYDAVVHNGRNMPKIIVTMEKLLSQGHLKGIEDSIEGFCYYVGMGKNVQTPPREGRKK